MKKLTQRKSLFFLGLAVLSHLACLSTPYFVAPQASPTLPQELAIFAGTLPSTYVLLPTPSTTPEPVNIKEVTQLSPTSTPITNLPTATVESLPILYYAQAGDTLPAVAVRFGVSPSDITSPNPLPERALLQPGQLLIIPRRLANTITSQRLLPDSELVYSPSAADFDVTAYVAQTSGKLRTYEEWMKSTGTVSGAQVIQRVAIENSINPRLLLALLEYQSGWVNGTPNEADKLRYPMGYVDPFQPALFHQMVWAVNQLSIGYYGWREGRLTELTFAKDRYRARLAPDLNAGTVALLYYFAQIYDSQGWLKAVDPQTGFPAFYQQMFGDPWERAGFVEPLYPPGLEQPPLSLPFEPNQVWSYTGGPHGAWERDGSFAALDFAPPSMEPGCVASNAWVTASASGLVVRSERGLVVLDLDGDGREQTGWVLVYLHVASESSVPIGTWVARGDRLGHPSCEGGIATGTHVHIARKFNGEWIAAAGPVPFNLSGWVAVAGDQAYKGFLVRGEQVVVANTNASRQSFIMLSDADLQ